jgi:hypothetical protein
MKSQSDFPANGTLSYLIADEQNHYALLAKLNELKRATVFVSNVLRRDAVQILP